MSRALEKYLDRVIVYANRKEEDASKIRAELKDHLLKKIEDLRAEGLSHEEAVLRAIKDHGHSRIVGCGLRKRFVWLKSYIPVVLILFVADYFLLLGRFYWFGFGTVSTSGLRKSQINGGMRFLGTTLSFRLIRLEYSMKRGRLMYPSASFCLMMKLGYSWLV